MKKMLMTLAAAAAIAAGTLTVSAERYWKYNDTTTIDLDETSLKKTTNGHEILNFVAIPVSYTQLMSVYAVDLKTAPFACPLFPIKPRGKMCIRDSR